MPGSVPGNWIQYCNQQTNPCSQGTYNLVGIPIKNTEPIPSPGELPNSGIEEGSPALQGDSSPAELICAKYIKQISETTQHTSEYTGIIRMLQIRKESTEVTEPI